VSAPRALFDTEWVHVFEEDGPEGDVYRPAAEGPPLSRRPRQRLSFSDDGSATLVVSGPDDRLRSLAASWTEERGEIRVRAESGGASVRTLRVRVKSTDLLLVRKAAR